MLLTILLTILGLGPLHDAGYRGEGVKIAIIDAGFFRANEPSVFPQERIKGVWDLIPDSLGEGNIFTVESNYHGTACLSTMLYADSTFTGTAPEADYYLIRTEEIKREHIDEVYRLMDALRLADSLDVDIITISLGYHTFDDTTTNYTYADMDGRGPLAVYAAEIAERRLVCVAAGNDGNNDWHYISTPSDAYNVITVGAVDSVGNPAGFSSWGPTADGRLKPEVSAWGAKTWIYKSRKDTTGYTGEIVQGNGTSFATPEIAGMLACLKQALPDYDIAQIRQAVFQSANAYSHPDDQRGYGVPNAAVAMQIATGVETYTLPSSDMQIRRFIEHGQVIIERNGQKYTILGRKL